MVDPIASQERWTSRGAPAAAETGALPCLVLVEAKSMASHG